jgi:uncharacterized protein (TIGR03382 family)
MSPHRLVLLLSALATLLPLRALACSCFPGETPAEAVQRSEAIFIGRVLSVERPGRFTFGKWAVVDRVARFEVITSWKGITETEVALGTSYLGGCDPPLRDAAEYLVFAAPRTPGGVLWIMPCSPTQEFSPGSEIMKYLGSRLTPLPLKPKAASSESSCTSTGTGTGAFLPALLLVAGLLCLRRKAQSAQRLTNGFSSLGQEWTAG